MRSARRVSHRRPNDHGLSRRAVVAACVVCLVAVLTVMWQPVAASPVSSRPRLQGECDRTCRKQLRAARRATAPYRDPAAAIRHGYVPVTGCDSSAEGTVGIHFFNDRNGRTLRVTEPELLIYVPDRQAQNSLGLRLVAIEYFITVQRDVDGAGPLPMMDHHSSEAPTRPFRPARPPVLFGHRFEGPLAHAPYPTMWHYDLHVWAWARNPSGLFAHYNPSVDCLP